MPLAYFSVTCLIIHPELSPKFQNYIEKFLIKIHLHIHPIGTSESINTIIYSSIYLDI